MADFGIDTSVLDGPDQDLDDTFREVSDVTVLLEDAYKALTTPSAPVVVVDGGDPQPLLFWEQPPVSFDLRDSLNDSLSPAEESALAGRVQAIYAQDRRFDNLAAQVSYDNGSGTLTADLRGRASGQPLRLVLTAGTNGVEVAR